MSTHFSAIGFELENDAQLLDFARECVGKSDAYQSQRRDFAGAGFRWEAGRGIEVWTAVRPLAGANGEGDYEIVSCLPAWRCEEKVRLRAYRIVRHASDSAELVMQARLEDGRELSFALVNLWQNPSLLVRGLECEVHLAGLALEAECSLPQDAPRLIDERRPEAPLDAVDSALIPLDRDNHYRLAGKIVEADVTSNIHSGRKLWRVKVEMAGLQLPLVFGHSLSENAPAAGMRFDGLVWLCGLLP